MKKFLDIIKNNFLFDDYKNNYSIWNNLNIFQAILVGLTENVIGRTYNSAHWTNVILDPDSSDSSDLVSNRDILYSSKRNGGVEQHEEMHISPRELCSLGNPWQWFCPCETDYGIVDLGLGNYPQYLNTAQCIQKPCHGKFNPCKVIHYKVQTHMFILFFKFEN